MNDLAVIIVSYNVREYLGECVASVLQSTGLTLDVWVVDNASSDGSADMVAERFPQVHLIRSPHNGGYAYANNLALRELGIGTAAPLCRYALLLNPDTRVQQGDLAQTVGFADQHPDAGVVGVKLVRQDSSLDLACRRSFPTPAVSLTRMLGLSRLFPRSRLFGRYNLTYLDPDQTAEVDAVVGAFMLVRRQAIEQAGLLDEAYFMYGEDLDWALQIKQRGWKVVYYPTVTVLHYKRASSNKSLPRTTRAFYESMLIFYRKHYASTTPAPLHWLVVGGIHVSAVLALLRGVWLPRLLRRLRPDASSSAPR